MTRATTTITLHGGWHLSVWHLGCSCDLLDGKGKDAERWGKAYDRVQNYDRRLHRTRRRHTSVIGHARLLMSSEGARVPPLAASTHECRRMPGN